MSIQKSSFGKEGVSGVGQDEHEIRALWDGILDILLERINHKSIPIAELGHLNEELNILLRAMKGKTGVWRSVIDVSLILLRKDATARDLRAELPYNESTLYRALNRLEMAGFATVKESGDGSRIWTVNSDRCPVLHRARRPA
jgi:hypothetical protein